MTTIDLSKPLLKPAELTRILNLSRASVYKLLKSGAIPTVRINKSVRIYEDDLQDFITNCWSGSNICNTNQ